MEDYLCTSINLDVIELPDEELYQYRYTISSNSSLMNFDIVSAYIELPGCYEELAYDNNTGFDQFNGASFLDMNFWQSLIPTYLWANQPYAVEFTDIHWNGVQGEFSIYTARNITLTATHVAIRIQSHADPAAFCDYMSVVMAPACNLTDCGNGASTEFNSTTGLIEAFPGYSLGSGLAGAGVGLQAGLDYLNDCADGAAPGYVERVANRSVEDYCYYSVGFIGENPAASFEAVYEYMDFDFDGVPNEVIHLRLIMSPEFVDNTYGSNAIGYERGHNYGDLVESDKAEISLWDKEGNKVLHWTQHYMLETLNGRYFEDGPNCQKLPIKDQHQAYCDLQAELYGNFMKNTPTQIDMIYGDRTVIKAHLNSLSRNVGLCGYDEYTQDSPLTDELYTPNPNAPNWDYRVVYDTYVDAAYFPNGIGRAQVTEVHASPSKVGVNSREVDFMLLAGMMRSFVCLSFVRIKDAKCLFVSTICAQ